MNNRAGQEALRVAGQPFVEVVVDALKPTVGLKRFSATRFNIVSLVPAISLASSHGKGRGPSPTSSRATRAGLGSYGWSSRRSRGASAPALRGGRLGHPQRSQDYPGDLRQGSLNPLISFLLSYSFQAFTVLQGDTYATMPWLVDLVMSMKDTLADNGARVIAVLNTLQLNPHVRERNRLRQLAGALHDSITVISSHVSCSPAQERFTSKWEAAFPAVAVGLQLPLNSAATRLPLIAAALSPLTWKLEKYFEPQFRDRVLSEVKRLYLEHRAMLLGQTPRTPSF